MTRKYLHWMAGGLLTALLALVCTAAGASSPHLQTWPLPAQAIQAFDQESLPDASVPASPREIAASLRELVSQTAGQPPVSAPATRSGGARSAGGDSALPGEVILKPGAMTPRQIVLAPEERFQGKTRRAGQSNREHHLETAIGFLSLYRDVLKLDDPEAEQTLIRYFQDETGRSHARFAQEFNGIPVWPAQWQVSLTPDGRVERFSGAYAPTPKRLVLEPTVDRYRAIEAAFAAVADAGLSVADPAAVGIDEELIIFAPGDRPVSLAWKVELHFAPDQVWRILVDAHAGLVLDAYNTIPGSSTAVSGAGILGDAITVTGWAEGGDYLLIDKSKPMFTPGTGKGLIQTLDARNQDGDNLWYHGATQPTGPWVPDGLSLHRNMSLTYDYFQQVHKWNSFDGKGHDIIGITRIGQNYYNAFWNPHHKVMGYGDARPFAADLGVVAHEFTHAVTSSTSNLVYRDQSGSANEAMSDIFGVAADAWAKGRINWTVGYIAEDGGMRSLSNPGSIKIAPSLPYVYPSKMSEYLDRNHPLWQQIGNDDNGGVHINNMIVSHAFYLMAEALPGAIGLERAAAIFFRANTVHLLNNSQFVDVRLACIASAEELHGKGSPEALIVAQAFDAVEIYDPAGGGGSGTSTDPSEVPVVSGPDNDLFLYSSYMGNFLGRREAALNDPDQGTGLSFYPVATIRPSVSLDGSVVSYVSSDFDFVIQATDGSDQVEKLGYPGQVYSTAMSPDGNKFAFVFMDGQQPSNKIFVYDMLTDEAAEYQLLVQLIDAPPMDGIRFAEIMTFTANGRYLIYDAFSVYEISGRGDFGAWAIYALDLDTGASYALVSSDQGLQIGNPSLANTTNDMMVMDVYDPATNTNTILAMNLLDGTYKSVGQIQGMVGVPAYSGDDRAVIYSYPNPQTLTGFSLARQPLAADRITPQGDASWYLAEGFAGVIYRRGTYDSPDPRVSLSSTDLSFGAVNVGHTGQETFTITNTGYGMLEIQEFAISGSNIGAFSMTGPCLGRQLARQDACAVQVRFVPDGEGPMSASVEVRTNDPLQPGVSVMLSGQGRQDGSSFTSGQWVTSFYVAYWGRSPDASGHAYWLGMFNQGRLSISDIAENFALQDEAKAAYPYFNAPHAATESQVNDFVRSVYRNLLDREVSSEDAGVVYWVGELRSGKTTPGAVIGHIIYAAMQGAGADWQTVWNKVQAASQGMY